MSTIGIRAHWSCDTCRLMATTHHVEHFGVNEDGDAIIKLNPPTGWWLLPNGRGTFCPDHRPKPIWKRGLLLA